MTNVEALLLVEAGKVPDGVEVFYETDAEAPRFRAWLILAMVMTGATAVTAFRDDSTEGATWEIALMALFAAFAALMAVPTHDPEEKRSRPRILVMGPQGMITRDPWGLQNWDYDELQRVSTCWLGGRPHLLIEDHSGKEHLLDFATFQGSGRIIALLKQRVGG